MKKLIKRGLIFIDSQESMEKAIKIMRESNISSIFATSEAKVVGVISERDIVQKFTLLDKVEKLSSKVEAFMTRPVHFARLQQLEDDVRHMFFKYHIRHFPITTKGIDVEDIIGLITVTDIANAYLKDENLAKPPTKIRPIVLMAATKQATKDYEDLFRSLKFSPQTYHDLNDIIEEASQNKYPVILDIDRMPLEKAKKQLSLLKKHEGVFIILSSEQQLVDPLAKILANNKHFVSLKPLDIGKILFLMQSIDED
ncbi:MAG: CBS domain-containing protein [Oligoflexus sp.]